MVVSAALVGVMSGVLRDAVGVQQWLAAQQCVCAVTVAAVSIPGLV